MQEQDDYEPSDYFAETAAKLLKDDVDLLVDAVSEGDEKAIRQHLTRLQRGLHALTDCQAKECVEIGHLVHRFTDRNGARKVLSISPVNPILVHRTYGVYMAAITLTDDSDYPYPFESTAFSLDEVKNDLASYLHYLWDKYERFGWDKPAAVEARRLFQFTATDIPEVTRD